MRRAASQERKRFHAVLGNHPPFLPPSLPPSFPLHYFSRALAQSLRAAERILLLYRTIMACRYMRDTKSRAKTNGLYLKFLSGYHFCVFNPSFHPSLPPSLPPPFNNLPK